MTLLSLAKSAWMMVLVLSFGFLDPVEASTSHLLKTPRGILLRVELEIPAKPARDYPILIVAPGQSCNSKSQLFEILSRDALIAGFTVLRFDWAYCAVHPQNPVPSAFLANEIEDMETVLKFAKEFAMSNGFARPNQIKLVGKSQGSFVAYKLFQRHPDLRALALLTPVCTYTRDGQNRPMQVPVSVGAQNYPGLKTQNRPVLFISGSSDEFCLSSSLSELVDGAGPLVSTLLVNGDHSLRIVAPDGAVDSAATTANIEHAVRSLLNWLESGVSTR